MESETERGAKTNLPRRRVLIADDHALIRDGFRRMLDYEKDFEVIGEASDGREAVELCRRLEPDLVLMDVRMPGMDGLEATRAIKANQPEVSVLVITTYENADYLLGAIKAGAAGYILKDAPSERMVNSEEGLGRRVASEPGVGRPADTTPSQRRPPSLSAALGS
jgi:DNA-binding NarL/FixJ family response regulator